MPDKLAVSLIVRHGDGSVSSQMFVPTFEQFHALTEQLTADTGGPLYARHIPAADIREWAPRVGRLGVVI